MFATRSATAQPGPLVSASIVSHGDGEPLRALLTSLSMHEPADSIQLIVTDNLKHDLPDISPAGWQSILMLRPPHPRGFAANHNAALQSATGMFFCVLNPDVVFFESVFSALIHHLDRGEAAIAAPSLVDSQGGLQDSFRRLPSPWELVRRRLGRAALRPESVSGAIIRPDWIAGTFMLMRSETFARLGGFDEHYRLYFEDVDLCTRARLMGLRILVDAGLRLRHDPRRASRRAGKYLFWHVQGAVRFFTSDVYRRAKGMKG